MKAWITIAIIGLTFSTRGQSFNVSDTVKYLSQTTASSTPPHDFIELINNSGDSLNMRWIEYRLAGWPAAWNLALQDPDNYYNPTPDSGDFVLDFPAGWDNKMITNLYHNQVAGNGGVRYKLFPINDRADSINIYFYYNITQAPVGISNEKTTLPFSLLQSHSDHITISIADNFTGGQLDVFTLEGKLIKSIKATSSFTHIYPNTQNFSTLIIRYQFGQSVYHQKIIFK